MTKIQVAIQEVLNNQKREKDLHSNNGFWGRVNAWNKFSGVSKINAWWELMLLVFGFY